MCCSSAIPSSWGWFVFFVARWWSESAEVGLLWMSSWLRMIRAEVINVYSKSLQNLLNSSHLWINSIYQYLSTSLMSSNVSLFFLSSTVKGRTNLKIKEKYLSPAGSSSKGLTVSRSNSSLSLYSSASAPTSPMTRKARPTTIVGTIMLYPQTHLSIPREPLKAKLNHPFSP